MSSFSDSHWSIRLIFQDGYLPFGTGRRPRYDFAGAQFSRFGKHNTADCCVTVGPLTTDGIGAAVRKCLFTHLRKRRNIFHTYGIPAKLTNGHLPR